MCRNCKHCYVNGRWFCRHQGIRRATGFAEAVIRVRPRPAWCPRLWRRRPGVKAREQGGGAIEN